MDTQELDRIIASQLRETYRELSIFAIVADTIPWPKALPLVVMFLDNAMMADDYTLCELEATYHASRNAGEFTWDEEI